MNSSFVQSLGVIGRAFLTVVVLFLAGYIGIWQWMICRVEVPAGSSLLVRYKGPWPFGRTAQAPEGTLVKLVAGRPIEVGIVENMPGPDGTSIRRSSMKSSSSPTRSFRPASSVSSFPRSVSRSPREPTWSTTRDFAAFSARS